MNIFAVNNDPYLSAYQLPDKHVVKMPLETCQMLSIVYSDWYHSIGQIFKSDGTPYKTEKGAFRNHPCTVWANESNAHAWWLLAHGMALCEEYTHRFDKVHSCEKTVLEAGNMIPFTMDRPSSFTRAMPDEFKHNPSISTFTAYKNYIRSKPWVASNYLRDPSRKPWWV